MLHARGMEDDDDLDTFKPLYEAALPLLHSLAPSGCSRTALTNSSCCDATIANVSRLLDGVGEPANHQVVIDLAGIDLTHAYPV